VVGSLIITAGNLLLNPLVKENKILKSVNTWWSFGQEQGVLFFFYLKECIWITKTKCTKFCPTYSVTP